MMETFAIVYKEDLSGYDFELLRQDSADTCRKSVDGTKALVSWFGSMPEGLEPLATYPADEIGEVISGDEWTPVIEK